MKNIHLNKWISVIALLLIIVSVFYIYLIVKNNCGKNLVGVQLLSMVVLISSVVSYLIGWKMILTVTGLYAKIDDSIDEKIIQGTASEEIVHRNIEAEVKSLIDKYKKVENISSVAEQSLRLSCRELNFVSGIFFIKNKDEFEAIENWAYYTDKPIENIKIGIGLHGQAIKNLQPLMLDNIPENYVQILSGTGKGLPKSIYMIPIIFSNECIGLMEFASFANADSDIMEILNQFSTFIGKEITSLEG